MNDQSMFNEINQVLQSIKNRLGMDIFDDQSRFTSALNDFTSENKKVKNLIRIAVCDLRAYTRLKRAFTQNDNHAVLKLAREMSEDYMIPSDASTGVIECIAALAGYSLHPTNIPQTIETEPIPCVAHVPGNTVRFGPYNWRVLDVQSGNALMLSDRIIEKHRYNEKLSSITWADCTLRQYLNGEFYNIFTQTEKSRILKIKTSNLCNPWFGTDGGKETEDNIFLLSAEEVIRYLGDSGQLRGKNPNNQYLIDDRFNNTRKALDIDGLASWWWLRSPGEDSDFTAYVCATGMISLDGFLISLGGGAGGGVRPTLWLNLN